MTKRRPPFLDSKQAEMAADLWATGKFDTADIAGFLDVHEAAVCRCLQAFRDMRRILAREALS